MIVRQPGPKEARRLCRLGARMAIKAIEGRLLSRRIDIAEVSINIDNEIMSGVDTGKFILENLSTGSQTLTITIRTAPKPKRGQR